MLLFIYLFCLPSHVFQKRENAAFLRPKLNDAVNVAMTKKENESYFDSSIQAGIVSVSQVGKQIDSSLGAASNIIKWREKICECENYFCA